MSRKVTVKELAMTLGVSVPTLRKYGECGLLSADAVHGRTNLYDESAAVARVQQIHQLKQGGYSLASIRERFAQDAGRRKAAGLGALDIGLESSTFSSGRHVLFVAHDLDEYLNFARGYVGNGLRAGQAVIGVVRPDRQQRFRQMLEAEGFDVDALVAKRQLTFTWYDDLQHFDAVGQVSSFSNLLGDIVAAGWQELRGIGDPEMDISAVAPAELQKYESMIDGLVAAVPGIVVCTWMAPRGSASALLDLQRYHREVAFDDQVYSRA